jgi:hypothetical protein
MINCQVSKRLYSQISQEEKAASEHSPIIIALKQRDSPANALELMESDLSKLSFLFSTRGYVAWGGTILCRTYKTWQGTGR